MTRLEIDEQQIGRVADFLGLDLDKLKIASLRNGNFEKDFFETQPKREIVKALTVAKLCDIIGVNCKYNYKSEFFDLFSSIVGQAICEILNLKVQIADDRLRFVRYNHINMIERVKEILSNKDIFDEAYLDAFNFVDRFRALVG